MIELVNHEVLVVLINEDGVFLEGLFDCDEFVEVFFGLEGAFKEDIDFEYSKLYIMERYFSNIL